MADKGTLFLDEIGDIRWGCNPSCCESYRSRSSNALEADERINWMYDSWLPRTGTLRTW